MSEEIAPGDVVRLKSGGPNMVVMEISAGYGDGPLEAFCEWFDDKKIPKTQGFRLTSIERVPPSPSTADLNRGRPPVV